MRRQRLIAARKSAGKSQERVAEIVGVDRTTVGTWERGEYMPRPDQRAAYAEAIGVTLAELAAMLSSVPETSGEIPDWLVNYVASEQSASVLRVHEPRAVFGLLQAPSYVEALVARVADSGVPPSYLQRTVEQRLYRQKRVRDGDLTLHVIQPESALRLVVGGANVMARQLDTLIELATLSNVTIQVTTYEAGQYEARRLHAFGLMTHPWGNPRVHIEGYGGGRFITDADEVEYFTSSFDNAARIALSPLGSPQISSRSSPTAGEASAASLRRTPIFTDNGTCIEVADLPDGGRLVRDTKLGEVSPVLQYTADEWRAFVAGVKAGEFD